jgi:hypothetical protein
LREVEEGSERLREVEKVEEVEASKEINRNYSLHSSSNEA